MSGNKTEKAEISFIKQFSQTSEVRIRDQEEILDLQPVKFFILYSLSGVLSRVSGSIVDF